jgi:hypothetical protein
LLLFLSLSITTTTTTTTAANPSKCSKRCRQVRQLLKVKQRQKEEAMHIEDIERLITEIEMLKVVLYLVARISRSR